MIKTPVRIYLDKDNNIIEPTPDMLYQQRLDKVLSKFVINKNGVLEYDGIIDFEYGEGIIYYDENKFRIYRDNYVISLETVESLLNDLSDEK